MKNPFYRALPFLPALPAFKLHYLLTAALLLCLFAGSFSVKAQNIVDDSTKELYGPHTSRFRYERDIFNNTDTLHQVDSTIENFHTYDDYVFRGNNAYQDLGVLGSPNKPLFFTLPSTIGIRYGVESLDLFAFKNESVRYFNTRSPYSYINYNFFGKTRSILEGGFFRNISNRWNVGFDFKRIGAQKAIGVTSQDDPATAHVSFAAQTNYISADTRYFVLLNFKYFNHTFFETGGILPNAQHDYRSGVLQKDSLFRFDEATMKLGQGVKTFEHRYETHLYQQYTIDTNRRSTQVFHTIDFNYRTNHFFDPNPQSGIAYYSDATIFNFAPSHGYDSADYQTTYRLLENKLGLKGDYNHFRYALWVRQKNFSYSGRYFSYGGKTGETFLGGLINLNVNSNIYLENTAEFQAGRDYLLKSEMHLKTFTAGAQLMKYASSLFQQAYGNNFFSWQNPSNDFTRAQRLYADITLQNNRAKLHLGGEYTVLENYIFMNQYSIPQAAINPIQVAVGTLDFLFRLGHFHFDNYSKFSGTGGPDVIRMPKIFLTMRWYYQGAFFKNALRVQSGFNVRWKSGYKADYYNSTMQTYYIQPAGDGANTFVCDPYFVVDPFINFGIKRTTFFLKLDNAFQGIGSPGYFPTPYYNGQKRIFLIGLYWPFFD